MAIAIVKPQLVTLNCFPFDLDAQRPVGKPGLDSGLDSGLDWLLLNGVGINKKKKKKRFYSSESSATLVAVLAITHSESDVLFSLLVTCNTTYACKTTRPFIVGREISDCFTPHRAQPHFNSTPAAN